MLVDPVLGLHSLGTMARALSVSRPLEPLFEIAAEEALLALHAASVSLGRLESGGRSLRTLINVGDLAPTESRWPREEVYWLPQWGTAARAFADGVTRTDRLGDEDCHPKEAELLEALGKGSSVTAAIRVDGVIWGEFYATRHPGQEPFATSAVDYVDVLTAIVGAAIGRSLREAELAYLAFHDALTGALNRRGLDHSAAEMFDPPSGSSRAVTVATLDINGLKQVNDQDGHTRGDALIKAVASALHRAFAPYPGSLVARVGGDEFVVLVPDHDPAQVVETVEDLCRRTGPDWTFGPIAGVSAGVSSTVLTGRADASRADLLAAADRALYAAKRHPFSAAIVSTELAAAQHA